MPYYTTDWLAAWFEFCIPELVAFLRDREIERFLNSLPDVAYEDEPTDENDLVEVS